MSKTETQSEALTPQLRLRFAATQHLALCKKFGAEGFKLDLPQDAVQEVINLLDHAERLDAENKALRARLEAPAKGEVLVEVSGRVGSGKSAICGEIEIMCLALGLDVSWPGGDPEKAMTHADWTAALEAYKPRVRIVERDLAAQAAAKTGDAA